MESVSGHIGAVAVVDELELYLYAKCSSCRDAEGLLRAQGATFRRRGLFGDRLSADELRALFARTALSPNSVLSKRSRPYGELKLGEQSLTDDEIIELMAHYPALIRRPLIARGGTAVVGFDRSAIVAIAGA